MRKILITGADGFIGSVICNRLASNNEIIGVDIEGFKNRASGIVFETADISDLNSVTALCEKHCPEVLIHCAGIAHQKIGAVDANTYMRVNAQATEDLAKAAAKYNPNLRFVFLSSVSVYGEDASGVPVAEDSVCRPSSDYALSKLDAEGRLINLYNKRLLNNLVILRLAPVYDRDWSFNLDRRVFTPKKIAYLRFGSGRQRISALARPNLVDFIDYLIMGQDKGGAKTRDFKVYNVCDAEPYEFNTIIGIFRKSGVYAKRPIISVPVFFVWILTRIASILFFYKRKWIHSCYNKLASDLVFDNQKMLKTGFKLKHSLNTIYLS